MKRLVKNPHQIQKETNYWDNHGALQAPPLQNCQDAVKVNTPYTLHYHITVFIVTVHRLVHHFNVHYPCNRLWRPVCLLDVEAPTFSTQSAHRWRWGCQPYAPAILYPTGKFLVLSFVTGWVDPRAIMQLEGLGQSKNAMRSGGIETAIFRIVAQCLSQLYMYIYGHLVILS
jgi:hypothetical protein